MSRCPACQDGPLTDALCPSCQARADERASVSGHSGRAKREPFPALPIRSWPDLVAVEPSLADFEAVLNGSWSYEANRVLNMLVGWYRGRQSPDVVTPWQETRSGFGLISAVDIVPMLPTEPMTETERWLRTSAAFDMARDHLQALAGWRA